MAMHQRPLTEMQSAHLSEIMPSRRTYTMLMLALNKAHAEKVKHVRLQ